MSDNFLPVRTKFKFRGSTTRLDENANQSRVFQFLIDGVSPSASIYRLAPCLKTMEPPVANTSPQQLVFQNTKILRANHYIWNLL